MSCIFKWSKNYFAFVNFYVDIFFTEYLFCCLIFSDYREVEYQFPLFSLVPSNHEIQYITKGIYIYITRDIINKYKNDKIKSQRTSHFWPIHENLYQRK